MDSFKKEMHENEATRDMATLALAVTNFVYQTNCNVWNGLSLRFCHGHGIDWSN